MIEDIKDTVRSLPVARSALRIFRRWQLHREYRRRREYYQQRSDEQNVTYRESDVIEHVRDRLDARGYVPTTRETGDVHTFAFIPIRNWHEHLLPDLRALGPVTLFDYTSEGYSLADLSSHADAARRREEMNDLFFEQLREAHEERPVDWIFAYGSGDEVSVRILERIRSELGIPTVHMCFDAKQSWKGEQLGNQRDGQIDIAPQFDLTWTSALVSCEWYLVEGARPIYMPEAFDLAATRYDDEIEQDIGVSFVGYAYGFRPDVIRSLRNNGIRVETFGGGWERGWIDDPVEIFNRSLINLGMGGIGYSEELTNVKGRDFEIPAIGKGMYLTSFNPDLARHYDIGREIVCYRSRIEMTELIRYYLAHPDEARQIARRGRERCHAEHRWIHRYKKVLKILEII